MTSGQPTIFGVLIETGSKQQYVSASDDVADVRVASAFVRDIGNAVIAPGLRFLGLRRLPVARWLQLDPSARLGAVSVAQRTSGKWTLLVSSRAQAEAIVWEATRRALVNLPGLVVTGSIAEVPSSGTHGPTAVEGSQLLTSLHDRERLLRSRLDPVTNRFSWAPCAGASPIVAAQRQQRCAKSVSRMASGVTVSLDGFDLGARYAVVHIDGNGVGAVFRNLGARLAATASAEDFFRFASSVSRGLERCVGDAFQSAVVAHLPEDRDGRGALKRNAVLLVQGGDDITFITGADTAIPALRNFLHRFAASQPAALRSACDAPITCAAGVVFAPGSVPLSTAMRLTEVMTRRAKLAQSPDVLGAIAILSLTGVDGDPEPAAEVFAARIDCEHAWCERHDLELLDERIRTVRQFLDDPHATTNHLEILKGLVVALAAGAADLDPFPNRLVELLNCHRGLEPDDERGLVGPARLALELNGLAV